MEKTPEKAFLWKYRNDEEAQCQLNAFLTESSLLIRDYQSEFSTQLNELVYVMKARVAGKSSAWRDSYKAQRALAVLDVNKECDWRPGPSNSSERNMPQSD
jgi:hypothetical protein